MSDTVPSYAKLVCAELRVHNSIFAPATSALANHQAKLDAREDCTVNVCRQVYVPTESKTYK